MATIQPLQLPPIINSPQVDFSALGQMGPTIHDIMARRQAPDLVAGAFAPAPNKPLPQPTASETGTPLNALGTGAASQATAQPTDAMAFAPAISKVESSGNYSALGPVTHSGDRALGKYQVMASNVPQWTQEALGVSMTPEQFLASPQAQDAVFKSKFGQYVQKYGPEGAAKAWFAGEGGMTNPNAADQLGTTVAQYAQRFTNALGRQPANAPQIASAPPQQAMPGLTPEMGQRIGAMLANPYTAKLGQALLAKYAAPSYGFQTLPNGTVLRTDTLHGTVQPVYQAQTPFGFQTLADGTIVRTNAAQGTVQPVFEGSAKPIAVKPGETLVNPKTLQDVYHNSTGMFDDKTLTSMADQYIAGDKSVFQNLGRGAQAAENIVALRQKVQQRMEAKGISPEQQAVKMAEYNGMIQTQRTLGSRIANIEMAVTEAQQLAPQVLETSAAVDRTRFPAINKILLAGEKGIGDPSVVKLGIALNSFINVYSRAINPGGAPTVNDKEHARELLSDAWSSGQLQAGMGQLMKEMDLARQSPDIVRKSIREQYSGNGAEKPAAAPATKVQSYSDVTQSLANGKAAIAKGVPKEQVIKRLIESGVPPAMANRLQ